MQQTDDGRAGRPSASSVYRYAACPGSFRLSKGCGEFRTREMKEWGESGDRIHAALAGGSMVLRPDELEVFEKCRDQGRELVHQLQVNTVTHVETRLWLTAGRKKLLSGKADQISFKRPGAQGPNHGVVLDYKTNRGDQDDASENHQLRTLVVLAAEEWPHIDVWHAAIIQPLVTSAPTVVTYTRENVAQAKTELVEILAAINQPDAPTRSGIHCKFCPAVLKCESAKGLLKVFGMIDPAAAEGEVLAGYLELAKAAEPIIKQLKERGRELLKNSAGCIPGWQLGKPQTVRSIKNPFVAYTLLAEAGHIDRDTFLTDCVDVSVGDLEKAVAKFKGLKPGEARDVVNAVCIEVMEFKTREPSLEQA